MADETAQRGAVGAEIWIGGRFDNAKDVDIVRYSLTAGRWYVLRTGSETGNAYARVRRPNGSLACNEIYMDADFGGNGCEFKATASGTYTVETYVEPNASLGEWVVNVNRDCPNRSDTPCAIPLGTTWNAWYDWGTEADQIKVVTVKGYRYRIEQRTTYPGGFRVINSATGAEIGRVTEPTPAPGNEVGPRIFRFTAPGAVRIQTLTSGETVDGAGGPYSIVVIRE